MEVRELLIIGIHTYHYFGLGKQQKEYVEKELGEDWEKYDNGDGETIVRVQNKTLPEFKKLLAETHIKIKP